MFIDFFRIEFVIGVQSSELFNAKINVLKVMACFRKAACYSISLILFWLAPFEFLEKKRQNVAQNVSYKYSSLYLN